MHPDPRGGSTGSKKLCAQPLASTPTSEATSEVSYWPTSELQILHVY